MKERLSNNEKATFVILDFYSTKMEMLLQEAYLIIKYILERNNKLLNQWVSIKSFKLK